MKQNTMKLECLREVYESPAAIKFRIRPEMVLCVSNYSILELEDIQELEEADDIFTWQ